MTITVHGLKVNMFIVLFLVCESENMVSVHQLLPKSPVTHYHHYLASFDAPLLDNSPSRWPRRTSGRGTHTACGTTSWGEWLVWSETDLDAPVDSWVFPKSSDKQILFRDGPQRIGSFRSLANTRHLRKNSVMVFQKYPSFWVHMVWLGTKFTPSFRYPTVDWLYNAIQQYSGLYQLVYWGPL